MRHPSLTGAAAALALATAIPAFAPAALAEGGYSMPAQMMGVYPSGSTSSMPLDAKMAQAAMAQSAPATQDSNMPSGSTLSENALTQYWTWEQRQP